MLLDVKIAKYTCHLSMRKYVQKYDDLRRFMAAILNSSSEKEIPFISDLRDYDSNRMHLCRKPTDDLDKVGETRYPKNIFTKILLNIVLRHSHRDCRLKFTET